MESQPVKSTLKLFRGFAHMDSSCISEANKKGLFMLMDTFIRSDLAEQEIEASAWLSVIDFTDK